MSDPCSGAGDGSSLGQPQPGTLSAGSTRLETPHEH